ncbi:UBX domain-containing protein [Thecamonas trahens ATCC 50062]|uniref:UBX domain-containing protein n=1 Tax=Thecamonas trahens ATCC 50062 TaxID=461836 RepID=A0A0L0DK55_THETB|nr:UBX domain-containing protein [Thecamonas trahens ATCC 50062]KNC52662.1 UBX domain-containing protein [Thecamonas trahens ATCC 50062]|eukprot:XP_013755212.1 UBX domain-containing protein [Thecamonas trahens ATCC 50062]
MVHSMRPSLPSSMAAGNGDGDDDGDDANEYYAGGERSGVAVQGRPDKRSKRGEAADMMDAFKALGAKQGGSEDMDPAAQPATTPAFAGTGFRLGNTVSGSTPLPPPTSAAAAAGPQGPIKKVVHMWANGFSVDDGPLRAFDLPANKTFLDQLKAGRMPSEWAAELRGREVAVSLMDHGPEEYKEPPKPKYVAFAGSGQTLGSSSSVNVDMTPVASAPASSAAGAAVPAAIAVDDAKPTTQIQIRLASGERHSATFNTTHTVNDLYTYVQALSPGVTFVLRASFPPKPIAASDASLADAGLLKAAVIQRLT